MKNQPEYNLQKQVCRWLSIQHPKVLFMTDTIASVRLTVPQQVRNKAVQKQGFHCPDLIVFEKKGSTGALFIELKSESPFKKDGALKKDSHLEEQARTMMELKRKGYETHFAWTFEMVVKIVEEYLRKPAELIL